MSSSEEECYSECDYESGCVGGQWSLSTEDVEGQQLTGATTLGTELFTTLRTSEVLGNMRRDMEKVNEILGLTPDAALLVLRDFDWVMNDSELERYLSDMENIKRRLNITDICADQNPSGAEDTLLVKNDKPLECLICNDEVPPGKAVALPRCRHFVCVDCFSDNLAYALKHDNVLIGKRCPKGNCCSIVGIDVFKELLPLREYGQVQQRIIGDYLRNNAHMRCCPNEASCEGVLHVTTVRECGPDVCCSICGFEFCFRCLHPPHAPATCEMMKRWMSVVQQNELSLAYIKENTKGCPHCSVRIEKNHGCNHMTCRCCRHEFCWMCLGPWREHNGDFYECKSRVLHKSKGSDDTSLTECFMRVENHKESMLLEQRSLEEILSKIQHEMRADGGAHTNAGALNIIVEVQRRLHECRRILIHGYIALYFGGLSKTPFHCRLQQLELCTEGTSELTKLLPDLGMVSEIKCLLPQVVHWCDVFRRERLD